MHFFCLKIATATGKARFNPPSILPESRELQVTPHDMSPLFRLAIASGKTETVKSLLERGANINARDSSGMSALLLAASRGRQDVCELLLNYGADPYAKDQSGQTAIEHAKLNGFDLVTCPIVSAENVAKSPLQDKEIQEKDENSKLEEKSSSENQIRDHEDNEYVPQIRQTESAEKYEQPALESDLGGWEPEQDYLPPKVDPARAEAAKLAQDIFSVRRASIDNGDWSTTKIDLPITKKNTSEILPTEVRRLLSEGNRKGWLSNREVDIAIRTIKAPENYKKILHAAMEQLQIELRPSNLAQIFHTPHAIDDIDVLNFEDENETADFLETLLNYDTETKYLGEVKVKRYEAIGIQSTLWTRIEELRRRANSTIMSMPNGIELLIEAGAFSSYDNLSQVNEEPISEEQSLEEYKEEQDDLEKTDLQNIETEQNYLKHLISISQEERASELARMRLSLNALQKIAVKAEENQAESAKILDNIIKELSNRLNKVIETNLGLVTWLANRYRDRGLDYLDLVQEGNIGLMKAVHRFDPSRGAKLSTYAMWWIRQSITRAISDQAKTIRVPVHVQEKARKLKRLSETSIDDQGTKLTKNEIIEKLGMNKITFAKFEQGLDLAQARADNVGQLSFEILHNLLDLRPGAEDQIEHGKMTKEISRQLLDLSPREERIIRMRFGIILGEELTLEEIGIQFDVTRERIRQIEAKAILRLSHRSKQKRLKGFLHVQ